MHQLKVRQFSVALSPTEKNITEALGKKLGVNFSAALRIIVREWHEDRTKRIPSVKAQVQEGGTHE